MIIDKRLIAPLFGLLKVSVPLSVSEKVCGRAFVPRKVPLFAGKKNIQISTALHLEESREF